MSPIGPSGTNSLKYAIECAFLRPGRLFTPDKAAGAAMVIAHEGAGGRRGVLRGWQFLTAAWAHDGRFGLRTDVGVSSLMIFGD